jgi:hypothetical protein
MGRSPGWRFERRRVPSGLDLTMVVFSQTLATALSVVKPIQVILPITQLTPCVLE